MIAEEIIVSSHRRGRQGGDPLLSRRAGPAKHAIIARGRGRFARQIDARPFREYVDKCEGMPSVPTLGDIVQTGK